MSDPSVSPPAPATVQKSNVDRFVTLLTLLFGASIICYLTWFNNRSWMGDTYILINATCLLFLPFLLIFGVLRERASAYGFRPTENRASFQAFLLYVFMIPLMVVAARFPEFQNYYPIYRPAAQDWNILLRWELTYGFYMFCWEFFYRGFLTFGLARSLKPGIAVGLQALGFGLMHYGKPAPEFFGSFLAGIALGILALRGKSFYPCFAVHWGVSITFDLIVIQAAPGGLF